MSHDRGCFCGREKYEYRDCLRLNCINKQEPLITKKKVDDGWFRRESTDNTKKKVEETSLAGYIIVSPHVDQKDQLLLAYQSLGRTPTEAWVRYTQKRTDDLDLPIFIQRWHDKGYRLKKVKLVIEELED